MGCSESRKRKIIRNSNDGYKKKPSEEVVMNSNSKENYLLENEDNIPLPIGEHFYKFNKSNNKSEIIKINNNYYERIELLFSLNNAHFPNNSYSFGISLINNKKTGIPLYLGKLKDGNGEYIVFEDSFEVDFFFEKEQIIIIDPIINGKSNGKKIQFLLCTLIRSRENKIVIELEDIGTLEIKYKNLKNQYESSPEISSFQFIITLNNDLLFKNAYNFNEFFYIIRNFKDGIKRRPVYKSHEYNFEFNKPQETFFISLESDLLCNDDNMPIFFELYSIRLDKLIGFNNFSLNKLKSNLNNGIINKIEIKSNEYENIGFLIINYNNYKKINLERIFKNCQINLYIAIDYTESNGYPKNKSSLHYIYGKEPNDYEKVIRACGDIISNYNTNQLFPVYGFGGIPEEKKEVSHCFNINFNYSDPNILGIGDIVGFYKESLEKVKLYGPTHFSPVIQKVMSEINDDLKYRKEENHYYVLMILTDGIICDMSETIDCIVEASKLPLSIIIIGIGDGNFSCFELGDEDEEKPLINSFGEIAKRNIVQFFAFNKFKDENGINNGIELAEEMLKEIPRQINEYYYICGKFYEWMVV